MPGLDYPGQFKPSNARRSIAEVNWTPPCTVIESDSYLHNHAINGAQARLGR